MERWGGWVERVSGKGGGEGEWRGWVGRVSSLLLKMVDSGDTLHYQYCPYMEVYCHCV